MTPTEPGIYLYTPDMPDAVAGPIEVVEYKGVLCARVPDDDEVELHTVRSMTGTWAPA